MLLWRRSIFPKEVSALLTLQDVQYILHSLETASDQLSEDVDCIVYRTDVFACGDETIVSRHIDIAFTFGEYCEIDDALPLFQRICAQGGLTPSMTEETALLYQKPQRPL